MFPTNVIDVLHPLMEQLDGIKHVYKRQIEPVDPDSSLGLTYFDWTPEDLELGGFGPTLSTYRFGAQVMVKHTNEEDGTRLHVELATRVRRAFWQDLSVRAALSALVVEDGDWKERVQRWGVTQQRFASDQVDRQFLFLSMLEFFVQTESVS